MNGVHYILLLYLVFPVFASLRVLYTYKRNGYTHFDVGVYLTNVYHLGLPGVSNFCFFEGPIRTKEGYTHLDVGV